MTAPSKIDRCGRCNRPMHKRHSRKDTRREGGVTFAAKGVCTSCYTTQYRGEPLPKVPMPPDLVTYLEWRRPFRKMRASNNPDLSDR